MPATSFLPCIILASLLFSVAASFQHTSNGRRNNNGVPRGGSVAVGVLRPWRPGRQKLNRLKFGLQVLTAHNQVRAQQGQPPLIWDRELADYAARWAARLKQDCKLVHSHGPHGENLFWSLNNWSPAKVVKSWAAERKFYDAKANACTVGMCGHYTQVIWRRSVRLGCARSRCRNGAGTILICEYDPPGNYEGESPFDGGI